MLALHSPDGFLDHTAAMTTALMSAVVIAVALRRSRHELGGRNVMWSAVVASFVFAAQMFNFPVASGATGHLVGAALAAILLGPWSAVLTMSVVVVVQAVVFADGGISALGYNLLNMAIVPALAGWTIFGLTRRALPGRRSAAVGATFVASAVSVALAALAFSLEWLVGATTPTPFTTVASSMMEVHLLIGVGEAVIASCVVAAVLAVRPDLVAGTQDLASHAIGDHRLGDRGVIVSGFAMSAVVATVVSQFAASGPDGLEKVAGDTGFLTSAREHLIADGLLADYSTRGVTHGIVALAVAGAVGVVLTFASSGLVLGGWTSRRPVS